MTNKRFSLGNLLFIVFWWLVQRINPAWGKRLLNWGLRDGAFSTNHYTNPALNICVMDHTFPNPVGVADSIDINGDILDSLLQMGFSFGEFGPYTLEKEAPPEKTIFSKKDRAVIVHSVGFPNPGLPKFLPTLIKRRFLPHYIGVSISITSESEGANIKQGRHFTYEEEMIAMTQKVAPYCDYIVVNISHPASELNLLATDTGLMIPMLQKVKEAAQNAAPMSPPKIALKIPMNMNLLDLPMIARILTDAKVDAVIVAGPMSLVGNTKIPLAVKRVHRSGMLYGAPVKDYANELIRRLYQQTHGQIPIIGCGGIFTGKDAFEQICAGASLVQLDSALYYEGPGVINSVLKELARLLKNRGFSSVKDAIGCDFK